MNGDINQALETGVTVVTVNLRLCRHLKKNFAKAQLKKGLKAWESPQIIPWSGWLQTFSKLLPDFFLRPLKPFQEQALWEDIIKNSDQGEFLLQVAATAEAAREAWILCQQWRLPWSELRNISTPETRAFYEWAGTFEARCKQAGFIDDALLPDSIMSLLQKANALKLPQHLWFIGFDGYTPQQNELIKVLTHQGCQTKKVQAKKIVSSVARSRLIDTRDEIETAALWARSCIEENIETSVGIIVPNLSSSYQDIIRIFDDVFHPSSDFKRNGRQDRAFNVSLGQPLIEYPLVHSALSLLDLLHKNIRLDAIGCLLRSPFLLGGEEEASARALLDVQLRNRGEAQITVKQLIRLAQQLRINGQSGIVPKLTVLLQRLLELMDVLADKQDPRAWVQVFAKVLSQLGWPGDRELDRDEYQTVVAFKEALESLAGVDLIVNMISLDTALDKLKFITDNSPFQPETVDAPVQIMGVLEASGMEFDHMWVMGLQDDVWPPAASPNPFLPSMIQRRYSLPHSSAQKQLEYTRKLSDRLFHSAPDVVLSFPSKDGDRDLRPSSFILQFDLLDFSDIPRNYWKHSQFNSAVIEFLEDNEGPAVSSGEQLTGGTGLLKSQAACPFQAFARYRLHADGLGVVEIGLDPSSRGLLVHGVLEQLWLSLRDQNKLKEASSLELQTIIRQAVEKALAVAKIERPQTFTPKFSTIERSRLEVLAYESLELDRKRPPFSVEACEVRHDITLGGLTMTTVVDRIDRLEDETVLIIDYKTGKPSIEAWFGDRPDEPQLLLYSLCAEKAIAGVLFARIALMETCYLGVTRDNGLVPKIKAFSESKFAVEVKDWDELLTIWRSVLTDLAREFMSGHAKVDPKNPAITCRFCDLTSLCRINEISKSEKIGSSPI